MALPEIEVSQAIAEKSNFKLEPLIVAEPSVADPSIVNPPVTDSPVVDPFDMMPSLDRDITADGLDEGSPQEQEVPKRRSSVMMWILGAVFIILAAIGAVCYAYPAVGIEAVKQIATFFPAASALLPPEADVKNIGPAQIKITDLKQRFVEHAMMGNIRVVEGMAVNTASEPMTRIKVRAQLFDVIGTPVGDSASYCGNLLTDQELKTAAEEQIVRKLSIPQGTDISNDRVPPNGMVPFMIVFFREPPGVAKALVMPLEAERLLP